ncbi:MAG: hypothetical protein KF802_13695 [Bdellovibrionaceae bacterium]|nr:hypothetical protein [Pseudobdellovibrionaceae bacterium]
MTRSSLWLILFASLGWAVPATADSFNPYQFTGACGSQGIWTQQALQQTSNLRSVLNRLKDDANCKSHGERLRANLDQINQRLSALDDNRMTTYHTSQLPQEIGALRGFLAGESAFKGQVLNAMFSRMIEAQKTTEGNNDVNGNPFSSRVQQHSQSLKSLHDRVRAGSEQSLRLFNETLDTLPDLQQCLLDPQQGAQMLSASVHFLTAIVSGGQSSSGTLLAQTISKLASYARESSFAKALAEVNQTEFTASLSCLLEMTAENYCATRDARIMLDEMMAEDELVVDDKGQLRAKAQIDRFLQLQNENSPLAGYYLLTQNIPIITEWLQMVQLGAEPRLMTDADQKNDPITQIAEFQKNVNKLRAILNSQSEMIASYSTFEEQQNAVLKLVISLTDSLSNNGGSGFGNNSNNQNFFTLALMPVDIPFYLIGIPTPDAVKPKMGQVQAPDQWLQMNYKNLPEFNDPKALLRKLSVTLDEIMKKAAVSSISFYNKWFIVDKVLVTNRALLGVNYNVKESLRNTVTYLRHLERKFAKLSDDQSLVPILMETENRIVAVLKRFDALEELGRVAQSQGLSREEIGARTQSLSEELIKEAFNQFNVMLVKSGFLSMRVSDFVQADFQLMKRAGVGLDSHLQELYTASGKTLVDQIIRLAEGNPSALKSDLAMGLRIGKGNLVALETGLADSYANQIAYLEQIKRGDRVTTGTTLWNIKHPEETRAVPRIEKIPGQSPLKNNPLFQGVVGLWRSYLASFGDFPRFWNKQGETWFGRTAVISPDDEKQSSAYLKAQFCIQTLAFNNLSPFWSMCRDEELVSPFAASRMTDEAKKAFRRILNVQYKAKAWEEYDEKDRSANHSKRICAFRDYNRRNLVMYLTKGAK